MKTKIKKWDIVKLSQAMIPTRHPDTLQKARRLGTTRPGTAKELERVTGLDRRMFLWPDEFGNPWEIIMGANGDGNARTK